jgi:signal transduction histidine kinase
VKSIRHTLITTLSVGFFTLFAVLGTVHYLHLKHVLLDQFDRNLLNKANTFASLTELSETGEIDFEFAEFPVSEYEAAPGAEYYQVWKAEGGVLLRSPSLHSADLPRLEAVEIPPRIEDVRLPDGRSGRATSLLFSPHLPQEAAKGIQLANDIGRFLLVMARSREELDATLGTLLSGVLILGFLSLVGTALVVWWTVGYALRPLNRIARETESLDANDLNHRFSTEAVPEELHPIALRLNELFKRLEAAFHRERRFSADISHELRTPITELRTLTEVWLQQASDPTANEDPNPYFKDALAIADRMEHLVETLLALVRCQSDRQTFSEEEFNVSALVDEVWAKYEEEAKTKGLRSEICHPPVVILRTDRSLLAAIFSNLFSNAVAYTPRKGHLGCYIEARADRSEITINFMNTHIDLTPDDLNHLFDPFWQKDSSRRDENHYGLGLSLVHAYADLLNLKLQVSLQRSQLIEISIRVKRPSKALRPTGVSSMAKRTIEGSPQETAGDVINVLGGSCE